MWLHNTELDWKVAHDRDESASSHGEWSETETSPETLSWQRWSFDSGITSVRIRPTLPSTPVVVRANNPVTIPAGHEARFFVSIPMVLKVEVDRERPVVIAEIPLVVLSKTWFGVPTEGELCQVLKSGAARTLEETRPDPVRAVCVLQIKNTSTEPLPIQKFCLRLDYAGLYHGKCRLWTSAHLIQYVGGGEFKHAHFEPPEKFVTDSELVLLEKERKSADQSIFKKGFSQLSNLVMA